MAISSKAVVKSVEDMITKQKTEQVKQLDLRATSRSGTACHSHQVRGAPLARSHLGCPEAPAGKI